MSNAIKRNHSTIKITHIQSTNNIVNQRYSFIHLDPLHAVATRTAFLIRKEKQFFVSKINDVRDRDVKIGTLSLYKKLIFFS